MQIMLLKNNTHTHGILCSKGIILAREDYRRALHLTLGQGIKKKKKEFWKWKKRVLHNTRREIGSRYKKERIALNPISYLVAYA
jgi:hypothetical protein